jgi:hypothetical protein
LRHARRMPGFRAEFFRCTTPRSPTPADCGTRACTFIHRSAVPRSGAPLEWPWPRGGKIKFSHLQLNFTVYEWQGTRIVLQVNPQYLTWLDSLPLLERKRLLLGN